MDSYQVAKASTEIFRRFVERFPELVDPVIALSYWNALHTSAEIAEAAQLQFGVTELSISLRPQLTDGVRWLAEPVRRQPFTPETATQARTIAHGIFSTLKSFSGSDYPQGRFDELFDLIYLPGNTGAPQPTFRLGYALEFRPAQVPSFKWYAEPRISDADKALDRVSAVAHHLGLGPHWLLADKGLRQRLPGASLRGIGIDLLAGGISSLKVYYSPGGCDWFQLQDIAKLGAQTFDSTSLEQFHQLILKGRKRLPPNTVLLAVVLAPFLDPKIPTLKWDIFLPQLHTSDRLVQERILRLCQEMGLDQTAYLKLWDVVVNSHSPDQCLNVHQYASLDLSADGIVKFNVYIRSPLQRTEHTPVAMRPRLLKASAGEDLIVTAIQKGLISLADAKEDDYSEMIHRMVFPQEAGFSNNGNCCLGSVFQRAIVCRTFAMARSRYYIDEQALQQDLTHLLSQQDPPSGGWKYFPTLAELPPDTDDVAQVLLAFLEAEHSRTTEIFAHILELIERVADPLSGQVPSWLVDPAANDPRSQFYRRAIERWWGDGTEPEVVANLGFALWRLDPIRFRQWLLSACKWVASRQEEEGWWESTWYWGRTYGTWMATRLIVSLSANNPALTRAAKWWISSQSENGYWDPLDPSSLETAFGLETGIELAKNGLLPKGPHLLLRSANWLCERQADEGSWEASPFIRMDINRSTTQRGLSQPKYRSYSSRTITTAFCIQALLDLLTLLRS